MWEFIKDILILGGFILVIVLTITSEAFRMFVGLAFIFVLIAYVILSIINAIAKFIDNNI